MDVKVEKIISYGTSSNVYFIISPPEALIVDAGLSEYISEYVPYIENKLRKVKVAHLVFTHCHYDHVQGIIALKNLFKRMETYAHEFDAEDIRLPSFASLARSFGVDKGVNVDHELKDGDKIEFGDLAVEVWHVPGHTDGSIALVLEDIVFTGDTIFRNGVGRTDLPTGSEEQLKESVRRILEGGFREMYPGHGPIVVDVKALEHFIREELFGKD